MFLGTFLAWLILVSLDNGTHMNTFAANGTFQLYNPLRRLSAGQAIGFDFPFFHGIGIPLLHWPLFALLGEGVFAAETAKWLMSPIIFFLSSLIFFYAFFRNIKKSVVALALFTILSLFAIDVVWPGNSLIGIRGTFPVLVAAALLWKTDRKLVIRRQALALNEVAALLLLGLSLPFGTEQGASAILAYAFVKFIAILTLSRSRLLDSGILLMKGLYILAIAFVTYTIFTKGHPLSAIGYAFIDVPTDQGWYFGTDAQGFLTWGNLLPNLFDWSMRYMWIVIAFGLVSAFLLGKVIHLRYFKEAMQYLVIYGVLAFVLTITGYYSPSSQLISLERMMGLVLVMSIVYITFSDSVWRLKPTSNLILYAKRSSVLCLMVIPIVLISLNLYSKISAVKDYDVRSTLLLAKEAQHSNDYFASSPGWKTSIDTFRPYVKPGKTVWSLYTSVYDTTFGQKWNPSKGGEDYIIHALGDERRANYSSDFLKTHPDYVITLKPSYFVFEEWLWDYHWDIYQEIFNNYTLISENDSHYLWKADYHREAPPRHASVADIKSDAISLPKNNTHRLIVYSVKINYKAHSALPLTSRIPRYLLDVESKYSAQRYRISLPSQKNIWSFPVVIMPGDTVNISATTDGVIPFSDLSLEKATYSELAIPQDNMLPIENNFCYIQHKNKTPINNRWLCTPKTYELILK